MNGLLGLLAVVTFLIALYAIGRVNTVAQRLEELRAELAELRRRAASAGPGNDPATSATDAGAPLPARSAQGVATVAQTPGSPSPRSAPGPAGGPVAAAASKPVGGAGAPTAAGPNRAAIPTPRPAVGSAAAGGGLEEKLGARLPVWLGSIALALAGAFLVKYTFDRGLLSPAVRVLLGLVFGVALLGGGEWMRRSNARIAQGLSAAGIADLYACFLAAANLYHLVSPTTGFLFIALNTAGAVALAMRQGVIVAAVGMVGGFLTPLFLGSEEPQPKVLFAYFLLLQLGLLTVSRRRGWPAVPVVSFVAGIVWVLGWLAGPFRAAHASALAWFLLASVALAVAGSRRRGDAAAAGGEALPIAACVGGFVAMAMLLKGVEYAPQEWLFLAVLSAGVLVLARLDSRLEGVAWVPPAAVAALHLSWLNQPLDADANRFLWTLGGFALLFGLGAYGALFGARRPALWATLSAAFGVFALLAGFAGCKLAERPFAWGLAAALAASAYALLALPLFGRRARLGDGALAAMLVAASACASLAIPFELERQWLAVGWAVEVLALVALAGRLRVAALRPMALLLAAAVSVRLLLNPYVLDYPIGSLPLLNWLLYGYGVPLVAFALAAVLAARAADGGLRDTLAWMAVAFGLALVTLELRHAHHRANLAAGEITFEEWGGYVLGWMACGAILWLGGRRWRSRVPERAGALIFAWSLCWALLGPGLLANPLFTTQSVGVLPVVNHVTWVLGVPLAGALWIRREAARRERRALARAGAGSALVLSFLLVSFEVRQMFHGGSLELGATGVAERYAYSAAWILLGTLLLVLGIGMRRKPLRFAALAVMLLAVLKVFLYDLAALRDLYRVFSFLGLGASLLLLAWLYQRYVFREPSTDG